MARSFLVLSLTLLSLLGYAGGAQSAATRTQAPPPAALHVLVVHDPPRDPAPSVQSAIPALLNLLGHFDCQVEVVGTDAYQPGEADQHDAIIYVGLQPGAKLPGALLTDLHYTTRPVCWLGHNLDQLDARFPLSQYGFGITAPNSEEGYDRVLYRGQVLSRPARPLPVIKVTRAADCQVLAQAEGGGPTLPYAVRSRSFWYFADPPVQLSAPDGCYLVLCDQLHAFMAAIPGGPVHPPRRTALLCISGVNARTSADALRQLSNLLRSEKIPFAIAITPVYQDPAHGREIPLSRERGLVGILREAQTAGAAIICLGYTHQVFGRTGEEAEWWDADRDLPLAGRSAAETERRIQRAVAELLLCGLPPIAWATPQGKAGQADYAKIAEHFSTACERRLPADSAHEPQVFPFVILADNYGQRLLPDNLPPLAKDGEVERVLEQVHPQSLVPDPWVTATISPDAPPEAVRMLLTELRGMDYQFADLRHSSTWVRTDKLGIYTESAPRQVAEVLPPGWNGFLLRPGRTGVEAFDKPGRDARGKTVLEPGAVLVTYPPGGRPRQVFAFEGGPEAASHRLVSLIAVVALAVGLFLAGAFALLYLAQIFMRRA